MTVQDGMRNRRQLGRAKALNVTLYDADIAIVDGADHGSAGRSATIRRIIREWAQLREPERMLVDTPGEYMTAQVGE
jgi:hypothetical protein